MQSVTIIVRADWDAEAGVWVATSTDLPGLVAEADTMEELHAKLEVMASDLIAEDQIDFNGLPEIPMVLMSQQLSKIRLRN